MTYRDHILCRTWSMVLLLHHTALANVAMYAIEGIALSFIIKD